MHFHSCFRVLPAAALVTLLAACGGEAETAPVAETTPPATEVNTPAPAPQNEVAPAPGAEVVEVRMNMQSGGRFEPSKITARPGDVIRFVNVEGVHNVSFPQGNNPAGVALPGPSAYLTQPGQNYEMKVELPAGTYNFQCDPHAAMGMVGELTVTQ